MRRTYVVTGGSSGIGRATVELLRAAGSNVIAVGTGCDVQVDLSSAEDRERLVSEVAELTGGRLDGVVAVAGVAAPTRDAVAVNHFGMIATLEGLRPLLLRSEAPRAVAVGSVAALHHSDEELMAAMIDLDEQRALTRVDQLIEHGEMNPIYDSSKRAFSQWLRRVAPTEDWAGNSIPLNAIAPGLILTPMILPRLATPEGRAELEAGVPMPLNGPAEAIVPARLLVWLAGVENSHLCGQIIYVDGGTDALMRSDSVW